LEYGVLGGHELQHLLTLVVAELIFHFRTSRLVST
jgi:hypothetical protein